MGKREKKKKGEKREGDFKKRQGRRKSIQRPTLGGGGKDKKK